MNEEVGLGNDKQCDQSQLGGLAGGVARWWMRVDSSKSSIFAD